MLAWQRPTLAERKSATISAKKLSCHEASARIFPHLHAFLTHFPLVSSFRLSLSSSSSTRFSCQLFFSSSLGYLSPFGKKKRPSVSAHRILYACLATSYSCGT